MDRYEYWLASLNGRGLGSAGRRRLRQAFGSARAVYEARAEAIRSVPGLKEAVKDALIESRRDADRLARDFAQLEKKEIRMLTEADADYPRRLTCVKDRPDILFVRGRLPADDVLSVAVVGSRRATAYGRKATEYFSKELSARGAQIISGMAYGIDSCAHETALQQGADTFAVMGCGIDICYPAEKIDLYEKIRQNGGILSEFPPGAPPLPFQFPMRNRIIAGLADLVIVAEAREKSGSLITAGCALEQGKDVYIVPGRIDDPGSRGSNMLWFDGAIPALSIDTILEGSVCKKMLNTDKEKKGVFKENLKKDEKFGLAKRSDIVYSCLDLQMKGLDEIAAETKLRPEEVLQALIVMQLEGRIEEPVRGYYMKKI